MKVLHWDAINPYTNKPFTFDDPNLRWGSPSYYLEHTDQGFTPYPNQILPQKPKPKKYPRRAARQESPTPSPPTHAMSTFKYNVGPKPNGGFTTRAVPGPVADNTALLAAAASAAGITPEQAETAIRSLFAQILEHARGNGRVLNFLDHLSMRATSGGSSPEPDGFTTTESIKPDVQISFSAEVVQAWAGSLSIESQGEVGKVTPVIESIIRQSDKAQNKYTALGLVEMRGNHLNFDPADLAQGVFLKAGADPEVRVTEYAKISPGSVVILIPAGLTGALNVRVCTHINGSLRTATYTDTITNAP